MAAHPHGGGAAGWRYTDAFEFPRCDCRDHPGPDCRQVSPELEQIRGPYPGAAGVTAYERDVSLYRGRQAIQKTGRRAVSDAG